MSAIKDGLTGIVNKIKKTGIPGVIPGVTQSDEPEEEKWDRELHLYTREGFFYILIIDSDPVQLEWEKEVAEAAGCHVTTAETGAAGLEYISKDKYDVIFIALNLPRMDGIQTLRNMRSSSESKCRDSKVYVILPETEKEDDDYFKKLGFYGTVRRPVEKAVIESIIIAHAPQKMLPADERTLDYIRELAQTTRALKKSDIRLSIALPNFENNLEIYKEAAIKFCNEYTELRPAIADCLYSGNALQYMTAVRELREEARALGAIHFGDILDDHVNMAKDDTLNVAEGNWKALIKEWKYVITGISNWLNDESLLPLDSFDRKADTNGIALSESEFRERAEDIMYSVRENDLEAAREGLSVLYRYELQDTVRRKLLRAARALETDSSLALDILGTITADEN